MFKNSKTDNEKRIEEIIVITTYMIALGFLFIMVCSRSSFLYPINNWDDVNSYFTMGKGMMNGLVIYRDLYEQKGPYLYLLYGLAYLISHKTFLGVFIFEVIAASFFMGISYKCMKLFCSREAALILLPFLGASVYVSRSFYWGGAAEEFCLPLLAYSLYTVVSLMQKDELNSKSVSKVFFNGIISGIVLQTKYTMAGFYFVWIVMIILFVFKARGWKKAAVVFLTFLAGNFVTMIPWLIYFGLNGALGDWYQVYIYNNLFIYANYSKDAQSGNRVYALLKVLWNLFQDNLSYFIFIVFGIIALFCDKRNKLILKTSIFFMCLFLFLNIFIGGSTLPYYSIPLMVFSIIGYGYLGKIINCIFKKNPKRWITVTLIGFSIAGSVMIVLTDSMNVAFMKQSKKDYFVYRFADIIEQAENPTLANIGCLDVGLYTVTGIIPTCRFFQTNAISLQEMRTEQSDCITNGKTEFIVTRDSFPDNICLHYDLVAQAPYEWGDYHFIYYLFERKDK